MPFASPRSIRDSVGTLTLVSRNTSCSVLPRALRISRKRSPSISRLSWLGIVPSGDSIRGRGLQKQEFST